MAKVYFKEKQRYDNKLLLSILSLISVISIVGGINLLTQSQAAYSRAIALFIIALLIGAFIWWLSRLKMKVTITDKRIKFKISPVQGKKFSLFWNEIEECKIVRTSEIAQWSGGNIIFNHEKRFSLSGRNGLALKTKAGEHYFIGCKNIPELQEALSEMNVND